MNYGNPPYQQISKRLFGHSHKQKNIKYRFEVKSMGWILEYVVLPLVIGIFTTIFGIFLENKLKVSLWLKKILNRNSACNFDFVCELDGDNEKIESSIDSVLKKRDYKLNYDEKGYRTLLTAKKGDLESLKLRIIKEKPLQIALDSPIQTIVKSVPSRLAEITAILQEVKDESKAKVDSASLQIALPYHPTNKIKAPKGMKITEYRVELLDKKKVKIILNLNNTMSVNSTNFMDLIEAYRSIV